MAIGCASADDHRLPPWRDRWFKVAEGELGGNEEQVEQEVHRWYTAFDEATVSLIALGVSREQMIERIKRGGRKDA